MDESKNLGNFGRRTGVVLCSKCRAAHDSLLHVGCKSVQSSESPGGGCPTLAGVESQAVTKTVVKPHPVYTMYNDNSGPLQ
jgi:hypothetical protein